MLIRFSHLIPLALEQFFKAIIIFAALGSIFFVIGEMLPRKNFDYNAFPFHPFKWEKNGQIYLKIGIQKWKDRLPDMSKHVKTMFAKSIVSPRNPEYTHRLILETCVAELIHDVLILLSPIFKQYMTGIYGDIAALLYVLGNLPFIMIQRYNRPRLVLLMQRQIEAQRKMQADSKTASKVQNCSEL